MTGFNSILEILFLKDLICFLKIEKSVNCILFDQPDLRESLLPFTFLRPIAGLRLGIVPIEEKWKMLLGEDFPISFKTKDYLQNKFGLTIAEDNLLINSSALPSKSFLAQIEDLKHGDALVQDGMVIAMKASRIETLAFFESFEAIKYKHYQGPIDILKYPWQLFHFNGNQMRLDFDLLTKGRKSKPIDDKHTVVYGENIFIEEGVKIRASVLNAEEGPIYIGKDSEIKEGSLIRGPFAMGEHSMLNLGAKMQGESSLGPYCKLGGEVSNSIFLGFSSKVHDGFMGHSVVGEWCNIGADTNTSNLKNNYASVKLWNYHHQEYFDTNQQFCGLMLGDHSKVGINTMFNTGTVVGVCCNIFGGGFPPKFIPSFSWGGAEGMETFKLEQAFDVISRAMARRNKSLSPQEQTHLKEVFEKEKVMRNLLVKER
ncbi:MAG: GlmU family protein [Cytophagales bacterium]